MLNSKDVFTDMFSSIVTAAKNTNAQNDGDYVGDDELLHCGVCNEPKQCFVNLPFGEDGENKAFKMPCICQCKKIKLHKEEKEREAQEREERRQRLIEFDEVRDWTFEKDDKQNQTLSTMARNYVEQWDSMRRDNVGLLLCGSVGTGKSFMAGCIANSLIDKDISARFTSISRIVNNSKYLDTDINGYISRPALLVLDDFSAERDTEYMFEQVYSIINARYLSGKPLIITSNLPLEEIKSPKNVAHQRVYDRILEMCHPLEIKSHSRRRETAAKRYNAVNELLGIKKETAI